MINIKSVFSRKMIRRHFPIRQLFPRRPFSQANGYDTYVKIILPNLDSENASRVVIFLEKEIEREVERVTALKQAEVERVKVKMQTEIDVLHSKYQKLLSYLTQRYGIQNYYY